MKTITLLGSMGLLLASLAGCTSSGSKSAKHFRTMEPAASQPSVTVTNQLSPELFHPDTELMTLGPGDQIEASLMGTPNSASMMTVGPDGKIYFNLLPGVDVWGLTLPETKARLEKELAKYQSTPQVSVTLRAVGSKQVWLMGRVVRPGIYPLTGPTTILESLAQAGGPARSGSLVTTEELADLRHSFVIRGGQFLPVNFDRLLRQGDMSQNIYVRPGDFVYVPSALAQEVYVLGAVRSPRAIPYVDQMTLVSAISWASGGVSYDILDERNNDAGVETVNAYLSHVAIVRGSLTEPQVTIVDYGAIVKGQAPDVQLESGDIIYVPNSPYTTLKRYVNLILNTFSSTVAANEGVNAAGGNVGVGVSVPVGGN
ncbi:MAG: polysaccharide biosynthesis/export family protein [Verrucomicrobia subdivision 3 bacterium]|nr:polysaccharide biosynthesis/export family protein [Verrucomicrobiota bacterium]MCC6823416.1 polysaccharide biosynthesis/export family protein [Limisphaerales bacterium]